MMLIDAHQHFWSVQRGDYDWLNRNSPLYRDYTPVNFAEFLDTYGIAGTVIVQAAATEEETHYLLSLYDQHDWILGVVGWLDLNSPNFQKQLKALKKKEGFVGIRPMLQDLSDEKWILQPTVMENLKWLVEYEVPLDLLITPRHYQSIATVLKAFPELKAVINHIGKPDIAAGEIEGWRRAMTEMSQFPNVMCKLSGLITEAGDNWCPADFQPYIEHIFEVFGMNRVIFGSDWPVCTLSGSYEEVLGVITANLPNRMDDTERSLLFGENAKRFYQLKSGGES